MDYSKERWLEKQKANKNKPQKGDYRQVSPRANGHSPERLTSTPLQNTGSRPTGNNSNKRIMKRSTDSRSAENVSASSRVTSNPNRPDRVRSSNAGNASSRPRSAQNKQAPSQGSRRQSDVSRRIASNRNNPAGQRQNISQNATQRPRPSSGSNGSTPPRKKKKKMNRSVKRGLIFLLIIVAAVLGFIYWQLTHNLNGNLSSEASTYNISDEAATVAKQHRIINVLVFGVDGREDVEGERSDSTMIATADLEHGSIKVSSLMRDTYVSIPSDSSTNDSTETNSGTSSSYSSDSSYGSSYSSSTSSADFDKLNAAYSLGGPELALKTVNQNFDTAITDYISIDFTCMVEMVNAVGGVSVDITSEDELYWLNQYLMDVNDKVKTASPDVAGTGTQLLDGSQALAYCRIRYVGNGDFDRTQRQRTVFEQVLNKAMALNPIKQYQLLQSVMPYIKTSLTSNEIMKYAFNVALMHNHQIQQQQIPVDANVETGDLNGVSYVFPTTLTDNIRALYSFIYQIDYTPSSTAQGISRQIQSVWSY